MGFNSGFKGLSIVRH